MNKAFQKIAFIFFLGFGAFYLSADFLLNQTQVQKSDTLILIYETFDMPFYFSAGMYALATLKLWIEKYFPLVFLGLLFWILAILFTVFLLYTNLNFSSLI
jgi:hypothetical protein